MTTKARRKRLPKQDDNGIDRRRWRNNLPYGPALRNQWSPQEREKKLHRRAEITKFALTMIFSVAGSSAVWVLQTSERVASLEIHQATMESRFADRLGAMQRQLDTIQSWFGIPAPRNPGNGR